MHKRYLVTVAPIRKALPQPIVNNPAHRAIFDVGGYRVIVDTPDGLAEEGLKIDGHETPDYLRITEGTIIETGTPGLLQSGTYNQLIVDGSAGEVRLHNDTFGLLSCFFALTDDVVRISNSMRLLRQSAELSLDELRIAETFLFGGWTANDRIIFEGGQRVAPGSEYRFKVAGNHPPEVGRLTDTWTSVMDDSLDATIERVCSLWETALARHIDPIDTPIGLMLSGGLDSRMVAGGIASRGKSLVGLTFGDLNSDEVRIAGEVAKVTGAKWIACGLDADFPFEQFAFDRVNRMNETLYNLMWDGNIHHLVAEGVTHYTTGATFETILGGQRDLNNRRRMVKNLRHSVFGPWKSTPATRAERDQVTDLIMNKARKRVRNYAFLLAEPYRSIVTGSLPAIHEDLAARIEAIAEAGPISAGQIRERFDSENYQTQHSRNQERQLLTYGTLTLPTCDRDLASYLTNLPAGMKYDHALYYHVFRRLYPKLASIQVPNLGVSIDKSQLQIEVIRAWRIQTKSRLSSWVNFTQWMNIGDNLSKYENRFLEQSHFFGADAVRAYFAEVRAGRMSLYDGGETTGFLNLAMMLDENRMAVNMSH